MSFVICKKPLMLNYDSVEIPVEFLVLHYTAASLEKTLEIFQTPQAKASSHFVINTDGCVFELVSCLNGQCFKAWHAGESRWEDNGKIWENFNDFSIGIEMVNKNGNFFSYTKKQYESLSLLIAQLQSLYPALKNSERVVGHEHIASYRGKIDPGSCFNWSLFFNMNYKSAYVPLRKPVLDEKQKALFLSLSQNLLRNKMVSDSDWMALNKEMEESISD